MRKGMNLALALQFLILTLPCIAVGAAPTELIIAGWTGGFDKLFEEKVFPEFLKQNNVRIRWILGTSVGNIAKVKATRDNPEVDIVLADDLPQRAALNDRLWEPLDPKIVPNLGKLHTLVRLPGDQGAGLDLNVLGILYHKGVFKERNLPLPTFWNDFFRADLRTRVMVQTTTAGEGLMFLIAMARSIRRDRSLPGSFRLLSTTGERRDR